MASPSTTANDHGEAVEMVSRTNVAAASREGVLDKAEVKISEASLENQHDVLATTKSTDDDLKNMRRMGKEQQLVRNFRVMSLAAFSAIATAAWEIGQSSLVAQLGEVTDRFQAFSWSPLD